MRADGLTLVADGEPRVLTWPRFKKWLRPIGTPSCTVPRTDVAILPLRVIATAADMATFGHRAARLIRGGDSDRERA